MMLRNFIGKSASRLMINISPTMVLKSRPEDVKKGHFAVLASKGSEKKRFFVKIDYLNTPEFQRLLERAEQEYGFHQTGALMVPCTPQELEKILKI